MSQSQTDGKEDILKAQYQDFSDFELKQAFHKIRKNHTKDKMVEDLVQMNALMEVMKERNVPIPDPAQRAAIHQEAVQQGPNLIGASIGLIICVVGLVLTLASSGQVIFYGAIFVGFAMMVKNLVSS